MTDRLQLIDSYLDAAEAVYQAEGIDAVTVARLTADLGIAAPALYRVFEGKDALLLNLYWRLLARGALELDLGGGPRALIVSLARYSRSMVIEHPDLAQRMFSVTDIHGSSTLAEELVAGALIELGFTGDDLVQRFQMLELLVVGGSQYDAARARDGWRQGARRYRQIAIPEIRQVAQDPDGLAQSADAAFLALVDLILDAPPQPAP